MNTIEIILIIGISLFFTKLDGYYKVSDRMNKQWMHIENFNVYLITAITAITVDRFIICKISEFLWGMRLKFLKLIYGEQYVTEFLVTNFCDMMYNDD